MNVAEPAAEERGFIVFIGLMGAGKTKIGKRVARSLSMPFIDSDAEIEAAAGCPVSEIFERFGEAYFRDGERRVIARLLSGEPAVLATGGGAFMNAETRALIHQRAISVWLKASVDILVERTSRRDTRPLLKTGNPVEILEKLAAERYPVYGLADIHVDVRDDPVARMTEKVLAAITAFRSAEAVSE